MTSTLKMGNDALMADPTCTAVPANKIEFHFPEYPSELRAHALSIFERLISLGYTPISGRSRVAMLHHRKRHVIKIPLNDIGILHNNREQRACWQGRREEQFIPIATCRIFYADRSIGLPLLMMEYLDTAIPSGFKFPDWALSVDSLQVGIDHKRRVVAYDL